VTNEAENREPQLQNKRGRFAALNDINEAEDGDISSGKEEEILKNWGKN